VLLALALALTLGACAQQERAQSPDAQAMRALIAEEG
jgi:hypothetical protein